MYIVCYNKGEYSVMEYYHIVYGLSLTDVHVDINLLFMYKVICHLY